MACMILPHAPLVIALDESNMFIRFIFIKRLNGVELFLYIKRVWLLVIIGSAWTDYY
jgi:hypothetical protein